MKAIASVGKSTINIAKNAYETVYNKPTSSNDKINSALILFLGELKSLIETDLEKNIDNFEKNIDSFNAQELLCTKEDKELFVHILLIELYIYVIYQLSIELYPQIIHTGFTILNRYDIETYNLYNNSLKEAFVFRIKCYQGLPEIIRESSVVNSFNKTEIFILVYSVCLEIATNIAIENFEFYKKENKIKKFTIIQEHWNLIFMSDSLEDKTLNLIETLKKYYQ